MIKQNKCLLPWRSGLSLVSCIGFAVFALNVKANMTPAKPQLRDWYFPTQLPQNPEGNKVKVGWDIWHGNKGDHWKVKVNDQIIHNAKLSSFDSGTKHQHDETEVLLSTAGEYRIVVELCRGIAEQEVCTTSKTKQVLIAAKQPTRPYISWMPRHYQAASGQAKVSLEWNMWWGDNGDHWRLYDNGKLIHSAKIKFNSPKPQKAIHHFELIKNGSHQLKVELCSGQEEQQQCIASTPTTVHVKGATDDNSEPDDGKVPAAPEGLEIGAFLPEELTVGIDWLDKSDNEQGFIVERKVDKANWQQLKKLMTNSTRYFDGNLAEGKQYTYRIASYNKQGQSSYSNTATIDVKPQANKPKAPSELQAKIVDSAVILSWQDNSDNEVQFKVFRQLLPSKDWLLLTNISADVTTFTDSTTIAGKSYQYKAQAVNQQGASAFSNQVTITLPGTDTDPAAKYQADCATCHGDKGQGKGSYPPLTKKIPLAELTQIIHDRMPLGAPKSCVDNCASGIAQYILDNFVKDTNDDDDGDGDIPDDGDNNNPTCNEGSPVPQQLRLLTRYEYKNSIKDLLGVDTAVSENFPVETRVKGFDNNGKIAVVTSRHIDEYFTAAKQLAELAVNQHKDKLLDCKPNGKDCAKRFVQTFGQKAFRRPLSSDEVSRYQQLFANAAGFDNGLKLVIASMLGSPHFLYRSEMGEKQADGYFKLTNWELASLLSYSFWGTMPDNTLFEAAKNNQLTSAEQIKQQAARLLADKRSRKHIKNFSSQWLSATPSQIGNKDNKQFPNFTIKVRKAMDDEIEHFVNHVIFESSGQLSELYQANYVFANKTLAKYYGLNGVDGNDFKKIEVTNGNRGGILTLGSMLATTSHSNEASPIKRGVLVRERLLCQDLPPPPPDVDNTPPGLDPTKTTRERFKAHTENARCQSCHQFIDDVGFGFENFDGAGGYRTVENGKTIDVSGVVRGLEGLGNSTTHNFLGTKPLSELLANSNSAKQCVAVQYYRYTTGHEETKADACAIKVLGHKFKQSNFNLKALLQGITALKSFTLRSQAK
ncbi:DUF1592 domain-containing protein [Spartinivicinus poritis]|uniref:DUF1592 domain-containing protein n=1 Tax=Spartinivicinus poritis TaxID=2994640 RepID=A0ABT5UD72_9GAMM|nr:DUF1592 domain-containing protein [Spartinivicinus sp. A2-2]MDE1463019.1 DUF1592 domain-containing protein [Spartinivicinus sp. A2-2]